VMYQCALPFFPISFQAWNDYVRNSYTLSAAERRMLGDILRAHVTTITAWPTNTYGMSDREYAEFKSFLDLTLV
jgi:hypothetical protein